MGRGTALATAGAGVPAAKKKITMAAAHDLVRKLAADRYRADADEAKARVQEAVRRVGGQTSKLDSSVLDQGRLWATRLALIARRNKKRDYTTSKLSGKLDSAVTKIMAIIGELEAIALTDVEMGLFEEVERDHYVAERGYMLSSDDPLSNIPYDNKKLRREARELLEQYEIESDPKAKKGAARKNASKSVQLDEIDEEDIDNESGDDDE